MLFPSHPANLRRCLTPYDRQRLWQYHAVYGDSAVGIVRRIVARQRASIRSAIVGNWRRLILADNRDVEIDQPVAGNSRAERTEAMCCVADRAGGTVVRNVAAVLRPTCVGHDVIQVVALCA